MHFAEIQKRRHQIRFAQARDVCGLVEVLFTHQRLNHHEQRFDDLTIVVFRIMPIRIVVDYRNEQLGIHDAYIFCGQQFKAIGSLGDDRQRACRFQYAIKQMNTFDSFTGSNHRSQQPDVILLDEFRI